MKYQILIVGSGNMAKEYVKVLQGLDVAFDVVGRSDEGAARFTEETGIPVSAGGLDAFIERNDLSNYSHFIVATNVCQLYDNAVALLEAGARTVLVEKPCVLSLKELDALNALIREKGAQVFIAYNRRFFASVARAREIIKEDGGLDLVKFDFTEWAHIIVDLEKDQREKERWLLANSTHIIDLAFHFSGIPEELSAFTSGSLKWHPDSQVFAGAGKGRSGALISYGADWGSASRWWLELFTPKRKLKLCPVETLTETLKGTVTETPVRFDASLDSEYKPGLYLQTKSYLLGNYEQLSSTDELEQVFPFYMKIARYS